MMPNKNLPLKYLKKEIFNPNKRISFFLILVFVLFIFVIFRLFYLEIIHGKEYRSEGEDQYFYTTGDDFNRGSINFSNKSNLDTPAVEMSNSYDLAIDPKTFATYLNKNSKDDADRISLENDIYAKISKAFSDHPNIILSSDNTNTSSSSDTVTSSSSVQNLKDGILIDSNLFLSKINKKDSAFEIIAKNVNEDIANDLLKQNIKGLIINRKKSRVYFDNDIGAKVFGFVGYSGNDRVGLYGLEKYYNDILERPAVTNSNFFAEVFSDFSSDSPKNSTVSSLNENKQGDLNLTIDVNAEKYLHDEIVKDLERWKSEKVGGIIMNINDGSIVAMDEVPSFDPNNYKNVSDISVYNNDLVSGVYEMGSIIKPLTVAAALDSNTVNENTTYYDSGTVLLNGFKVSNYDKRARGANTPIQQILSQSLNVGIAFLVEKMGGDTLSTYFHGYGLGDYTGIDLPNEAQGLVDNLDSHVLVDSVTAGFGQGMAITPVQTIRALAVLGNGGKLVTPHVVKSIVYDNGDEKTLAFDNDQEVFKNASTSARITNLLIHVVDDAMHMKNPKYSVAAKTGTAQIANPNTGKYYEDRYLHSFFGYFPAKNPQYIIFLYQVYPKGAQYASQTLKDSFFNLVNFLIGYYNIPPDRDLQ